MNNSSITFQEIYTTYQPRILRYLTRLVGDAAVAEELTHDVLVKVSDSISQFRGESSLATWIYRISTNTALDALRRPCCLHAQRSKGDVMAEDEYLDLEQDETLIEESVKSAEVVVSQQQMNQCIRDFIERLPENYKTVMLLSELEGFKNSEISDILGLSLQTVKIRLHRAREKLRRDLSVGCRISRDERNEVCCERKS